MVVFTISSKSQSKEVKFSLHTKTHTPEDETVVIFSSWYQFYPMVKLGENDWEVTIELNEGLHFNYYYCRNYMASAAEEIEFNSLDGYRELTVTTNTLSVSDTVREWRWWPIDGVVPDIDYSLHVSQRPEISSGSDFQCGVELPDFWWPEFEPVVESTLDVIVENSNSTWVQYAPVPEITQFYPSPIIDIYGNNGTPDEVLVDIITKAHNRGLKFYLRPFQWALSVTDESPQNHSDEWWIYFSDQWIPIITHYAMLSEEHGVEMIDLNLWNGGGEAHKPVLDSLLCNMVDTVRSIYSGKLSMELNLWGADLEVYSKVDYLSFKIWDVWPMTLSNAKDPTVSEMLGVLRNGLDNQFKPWCDKYGKKLVLSEIAASSLDGSVNGSASTWDNEYWDPINENTYVDLQEQADVHEAMLQAITERDWITGAFSFNYNYWNSVDKAPSIRNKPAEKVLAKWWRWISPDKRHISIKHSLGGTTTPSPGSYVMNLDTTITLSAQAGDGFVFSHWSGDNLGIDSLIQSQQIVLDVDKTIKAVFVPDPTDIEDKSAVPFDYNLNQNYPNPFNPSTVINFILPTEGMVKLAVYNTLGEVVEIIVNEYLGSGNHSAEFSPDNLSSGIYFYQLTTENQTLTKKMVFLK